MNARWAPWREPTRVSGADFIAEADRLLEAAVGATVQTSGLARREVRRLLVEGLAESLSTFGPLAVVRLDTRAQNLGARRDLQQSAELVNRLILEHVDAADPRGEEGRGVGADSGFVSHCVGYVWTEPVAQVLVGPTGIHMARNHYNEWLWQLVTLRDALIPFTRPQAVRVLADADGLRGLEGSRDRFVYELTTRRITFDTLFAHVSDRCCSH